MEKKTIERERKRCRGRYGKGRKGKDAKEGEEVVTIRVAREVLEER